MGEILKSKINKLGVFSFAKFQAVLFALLGLLAGIIYSFGDVGWILKDYFNIE